ncbi:MAG: hypothetical protein SGI92_18890 [Bryobacteraceae bacterium]|nr:hypothetical protein [Bryobacteraceae bacterium]
MAKLKLAKGKKPAPAFVANPQAMGCILMIGLLLLLVMLSIYFTVANK